MLYVEKLADRLSATPYNNEKNVRGVIQKTETAIHQKQYTQIYIRIKKEYFAITKKSTNFAF